jgi:hypothetical protein
MKNVINVEVIEVDNIKIHPLLEQFVKPKKEGPHRIHHESIGSVYTTTW